MRVRPPPPSGRDHLSVEKVAPPSSRSSAAQTESCRLSRYSRTAERFGAADLDIQRTGKREAAGRTRMIFAACPLTRLLGFHVDSMRPGVLAHRFSMQSTVLTTIAVTGFTVAFLHA